MASGALAMPVIPPPDPNDKPKVISLGTSEGRVAELDLIGDIQGLEHGRDYSRNEIAAFLFEWAAKQWWAERKEERPKDFLSAFAEWRKKHPEKKPKK